MLYLDAPPAGSQPVEIRDIGGFVHKYEEQTRRFRSEGREVRLVYCRSACTMALSLPKACVYPHSKLFFHMAFNPKTGERREKESAELFALYPAKVRARLGRLTPRNQMLTGSELIALGVPECGGTTMIARAAPKPKPVAVVSADGASSAAAGSLAKPPAPEAPRKPAEGAVARLLPAQKASPVETAPKAAAAQPARAPAAAAPAEPAPKPKPMAVASLDREPATIAALVAQAMRFTGTVLEPNPAQPRQPQRLAALASPAVTDAAAQPARPLDARLKDGAPPAPKEAAPKPLRRAPARPAETGPATTASIPAPAGPIETAAETARKLTGKVVGSVLSLFR